MPTFRKRLTTRIDLPRSGKRRQNWIAPLILGLVIGVSACALLVWFLQQDSIGKLQPYLIGGAVTFLAILIFRAIFLGSSGKFARKRTTGEDESHSTVNLFVALLTGVASFLGMLLLMRQNELMKQQNILAQQQTALSEAARRSSYVMLMDNILNQVNEELKGADTTPYHPTRRLSTVTIGRIAALSQSLRPYRHLGYDDSLSVYLSPERGQLLLALVYARLDTVHTYPEIYAKSDFSFADLEKAELNAVFLREVNLLGSNLRHTNLVQSDLYGAMLRGVEFTSANLSKANMQLADLFLASFRSADLIEVDLRGADLTEADLRGTLTRAKFGCVASKSDSIVCSTFYYTKVSDPLNNREGWEEISENYQLDTTIHIDEYRMKYYLILPKNK